MSTTGTLTERELRVKRHVTFEYFCGECLIYDEASGLYRCPTRADLLVIMPMMEKVFDFDLTGVPGFYVDIRRNPVREFAEFCGVEGVDAPPDGGWMFNAPGAARIEFTVNDDGLAVFKKSGLFLRQVLDDRGRITNLHVLKSPRDPRPKVLTSKGLPLGT